MKLIALSLSALVTGCACNPKVVVQVKEVPVEIPVRCSVTLPDPPVAYALNVPADADKYDKVRATILELEDQRRYGRELSAVLKGCVDSIDEKAPSK